MFGTNNKALVGVVLAEAGKEERKAASNKNVPTQASKKRDARDAKMGVIKGGSFLCAANFCVRYRPASRQPQETTMSTQHVGFRTVLNEEQK